MKYVKIGLVALLFGGTAFVLQRPDLASTIDETVGLTFSGARANAADSGAAVDVANYACVAALVATKQVDITSGAKYVVLQDSSSAASWTGRDSIAIDSTDNKAYDVGYRGAARYLRLFQRASGAAGDTIATIGVFLKGCKRSR